MTYIVRIAAILNCVFFACTNNNGATNGDATKNRADSTPVPLSTNTNLPPTDTLVVDRKAAVFYEPDSLQLEKRKAAIGEDNFYAGVEDYAFYLNASHDFLTSTRLPVYDAKDKEYVKFISSNQTAQLIRLDTLPGLWGIYFFDPAKRAKPVSMTMIEEEYTSYFK